jgi:hypothetical protein
MNDRGLILTRLLSIEPETHFVPGGFEKAWAETRPKRTRLREISKPT